MYELVIIGGGPGGITAAIYAARNKMNFALIAKDFGGRMGLVSDIQNYPGFQSISGLELTDRFKHQLDELNVEPKFEEVLKVEKTENGFVVKTDSNSYETKTVIVASGARHGKLNVPGEERLNNRGVTYCATCDAPLFQGKDVAVVGSGSPGLNATLMLMRIAKKIYLIERGPELRGDKMLCEKIACEPKVTILTNTRVKEILGEKFVSGMVVSRDGKIEEIPVQGIFIEVSYTPNSEFVAHLVKLNRRYEIIIDDSCKTNVDGLYAVGDVTNVPQKQIVVAAGDGAKAVWAIYNYLHRQR